MVTMQRLRWLIPGLAVCALVGLSFQALGGDNKKDADVEDRASLDDIQAEADAQAGEERNLAYELIEYGRESKTPEALITAALILHRNPVAKFEKVEKEEGVEEVKEPDPKELLQEAQSIRPKDKALAEYVAKVSDDLKEEARGSVGRRISGYLTVPASKTVGFRHAFRAKQPAQITVFSTPSRTYLTRKVKSGLTYRTIRIPRIQLNPVKVTVRSLSGQTYYQGQPSSGHRISFRPSQTGPVQIIVQNVGTRSTRVRVMSN